MNTRNWTAALLVATAAALLVIPQTAQADWFSHEGTVELDASIPLGEATKLSLDFHVGELRIEHGPDDAIEVEGTVTIKTHKREQMEKVLAEMELEIETGDTISLSFPHTDVGKGFKIDLVVRVPRNLDLSVEMNVGELTAKIEAPSRASFELNIGELSVQMPRDTSARVEARVNIGDVDVSGFDDRNRESGKRRLLGENFSGTLGDEDEADEYRLKAKVNIGEVTFKGRG